MSLRSLLLVLLALNVIAFAGGRMGWLGESGLRGEPERLTNQIRPDAIELGLRPDTRPVSPRPTAATEKPPASAPIAAPVPAPATAAAPAVASAPPEAERCAAYIVRGQDGLNRAIRMAENSSGRIALSRQTLEEPTHWRVRIPPAANLEAAEQRLRTLQERGVDDMYIIRGEGPNRWSISLGLFSTENAAGQRLAALREKGFASAEIIPGAVGRFWVEFRGLPPAVEKLAAEVEDWLGPDSRRACSP